MAIGKVNIGGSSNEVLIEFDNYTSDNIISGSSELIHTVITPLSVGRNYLAATSIGNYALFGGGHYYVSDENEGNSDVVDAYDTSLIRTTATPLSMARDNLAATTVGDYALFGGGFYYESNVIQGNYSIVDAYDTSLTRTTPTGLSVARRALVVASTDEYALFGGGSGSGGPGGPGGPPGGPGGLYRSNVVDAYDTSLTRTTPTPLSVARESLAATSVGGYILFGGGQGDIYTEENGSHSDVVDAYDTSLIRTTATPLSQVRCYLAAASVGGYALFSGGWDSDVVDAYDTSLIRTTPTPLSVARDSLAATSVGNQYALFGNGGYRDLDENHHLSTVVDVYDTSLVRTTPEQISLAREFLAASSVGDYALFGGGYSSSDENDDGSTVDAYMLPSPSKMRLELPIGTRYKFSEHTTEQTTIKSSVLVNSPSTGYIKYKSGIIKS